MQLLTQGIYVYPPYLGSLFLCSQNMRYGEGIHLIQADVNLKCHMEEDMEFGVWIFERFNLVRILILKKMYIVCRMMLNYIQKYKDHDVYVKWSWSVHVTV